MKIWPLLVTLIAAHLVASHLTTPRALGAIPKDPPSWEQRIQDLGSDDPTVREVARVSLAIAEAIPHLEAAVSGTNDAISRSAAEVLSGLLDSENTDIASKAELAVADMENSSDEKVVAVIKAALQIREQGILVELAKLGWRASPSNEGVLQISWREVLPPQIDLSGKPVVTDQPVHTPPLTLLRRLRRPFDFHASFVEGKTDIGDLAALKDLEKLASISLSIVVRDGDLPPIATLPRVRRLSVWFAEGATGSQLEPLAQLEELEQLAFIQAPAWKECSRTFPACQKYRHSGLRSRQMRAQVASLISRRCRNSKSSRLRTCPICPSSCPRLRRSRS